MNFNKVSVVMCTFNGAEFIREQIESILSQTYPLFELLIFDDCSDDNTYEILDEYAVRNPVISLKKNAENIGFAANFKQALLFARGDVVAISDQDDIWANNKIEKMLSHWHNSSLLIYCDSIRFRNAPPVNAAPNPKYRRFEGKDARKIFLFNTVSGHAILLRKELLSLALPYKDDIYYDWWLAVVAAYNGGVSYLNETLVFQRIHDKNVSVNDGLDHTQKEQRNKYKKMVIRHLQEFKKAPNIPASDKRLAERFSKFLERSQSSKFYFPLFLFMIAHGNKLFNHKVKKFKMLSFIKYSYRLTFNLNL